MSHEHLGLFDTPSSPKDIRLGLAIVGLLVAALLLILPIRDIPLPEIEAFIPAFDAFMLLCEIIIASLLFAQASLFRSRALTVLATGYVFVALLHIPHALTYPGIFAEDGLLGAGPNTATWITSVKRGAFPIAVTLYVLLSRSDSPAPLPTLNPGARIAGGVCAAIALATAVTAATTIGHDLLPPLVDRRNVIYSNLLAVHVVLMVLTTMAIAILFRKRRSVLDMWLMVALSAWLVQLLLNLPLKGSYTIGWYSLYVLIMIANFIVMLALLAEAHRLYARLALSTAARNREREARLMSLEAMAGAISHEVGQPLSAVTTNAMAGLTWLTRSPPDLEKGIEAIRATIEAGHRTFDVVKSTRTLFAREVGAATEIDLNELVRDTASLLNRELGASQVSLRLKLAEELPLIRGNRTQLQQVLINLFTNAIEALHATPSRLRSITVRTTPFPERDVLLEIRDSGPGIRPGAAGQIFDAFFTTKRAGTGLGLSLSRTIVEAHGGRLWALPEADHGAAFCLRLPRSFLH